MCQSMLTKVQKPFERKETRFIGQFREISMPLDPDPPSQYGSGSRNEINADPDLQHWF
jgi:hypothetical protein